MTLCSRTKFQLEIFIRSTISAIQIFRKNLWELVKHPNVVRAFGGIKIPHKPGMCFLMGTLRMQLHRDRWLGNQWWPNVRETTHYNKIITQNCIIYGPHKFSFKWYHTCPNKLDEVVAIAAMRPTEPVNPNKEFLKRVGYISTAMRYTTATPNEDDTKATMYNPLTTSPGERAMDIWKNNKILNNRWLTTWQSPTPHNSGAHASDINLDDKKCDLEVWLNIVTIIAASISVSRLKICAITMYMPICQSADIKFVWLGRDSM